MPIRLVSFIVASTATLAFCDAVRCQATPTTPEETAKAFMNAQFQGELERAIGLVTSEDRKAANPDELEREIRRRYFVEQDMASSFGGGFSFEVESVDKEANRATVKLSADTPPIAGNRMDFKKHEVHLVQTDGQWHVDTAWAEREQMEKHLKAGRLQEASEWARDVKKIESFPFREPSASAVISTVRQLDRFDESGEWYELRLDEWGRHAFTAATNQAHSPVDALKFGIQCHEGTLRMFLDFGELFYPDQDSKSLEPGDVIDTSVSVDGGNGRKASFELHSTEREFNPEKRLVAEETPELIERLSSAQTLTLEIRGDGDPRIRKFSLNGYNRAVAPVKKACQRTDSGETEGSRR